MKISEKILLVTVFLSLLPVANLFALSQEAKDAIELLRSRIAANNEEQQVADKEYIPGQELSAALSRFKQKFHPIAEKTIPHQTSEEVIVVNDPVLHVIDQNDQEALSDIVNNLIKNTAVQFDNIEIVDIESAPTKTKGYHDIIESMRQRVKARESYPYTAQIEIIPAAEDQCNNALDGITTNSDKNSTKEEYIPGLLLKKSFEKYRETNNKQVSTNQETVVNTHETYVKAENIQQNSKEIMEKANQEIDELFNNPDKRAKIADNGRKKKVESVKENKTETIVNDEDEKQIDDDKFNDYISRYNFKMPENYRIIIE